MSKNKVYLVDGSRTPFLKAKGTRGPFTATELAVKAAQPLLLRHDFSPKVFDEVIFGCVMPSQDEANIARIITLRLGCGEKVPAFTVQRNCASGLQAVDTACRNIVDGYADLILAGGVEAMSHAPLLFRGSMVDWFANWNRTKDVITKLKVLGQLRPKHFAPIIGLLRGLRDPVVGLSMGQTAEILAHRFKLSRETIDAYAVQSHQRLANAVEQEYLQEIEPILSNAGQVFAEDDGLRVDSSIEALAKLKPVFDKPVGRITAGNSAQVTDGAVALILASEKAVEQYNLPVLAKLTPAHWAGVDPSQMGLGPVYAIQKLLQAEQREFSSIDYWEINEAFAAQVLACTSAMNDESYCQKELGLDSVIGNIPFDRLNVDGGGISLGHPVGASGARIVLHLAHVLQRESAQTGIASLCIGGGQGGAMLVERI